MWWYKIPVLLVVAAANHISLSDQRAKFQSRSFFIPYLLLAFGVRPSDLSDRGCGSLRQDILQGLFLDLGRVRGRADLVRQSPALSGSPQIPCFPRPSLRQFPAQSSHLSAICRQLVDIHSLPRHPLRAQLLPPTHPPIIYIP